jgi:hypothetical protein
MLRIDEDYRENILKQLVYYFNISRTAISAIKIAELSRDEYLARFLIAIKNEWHHEIKQLILNTDDLNLRANLLERYIPFDKSFCEKVFNENLNKGVPLFRSIIENGKRIHSENNVKIILSILKKIDKRYELYIDFHDEVDAVYKHLLDQ